MIAMGFKEGTAGQLRNLEDLLANMKREPNTALKREPNT